MRKKSNVEELEKRIKELEKENKRLALDLNIAYAVNKKLNRIIDDQEYYIDDLEDQLDWLHWFGF